MFSPTHDGPTHALDIHTHIPTVAGMRGLAPACTSRSKTCRFPVPAASYSAVQPKLYGLVWFGLCYDGQAGGGGGSGGCFVWIYVCLRKQEE